MKLWWLKTPKTTIPVTFWVYFFSLFLVIKSHCKIALQNHRDLVLVPKDDLSLSVSRIRISYFGIN